MNDQIKKIKQARNLLSEAINLIQSAAHATGLKEESYFFIISSLRICTDDHLYKLNNPFTLKELILRMEALEV